MIIIISIKDFGGTFILPPNNVNETNFIVVEFQILTSKLANIKGMASSKTVILVLVHIL